jgi:isopentenyl-diphosphate delta-isomerase
MDFFDVVNERDEPVGRASRPEVHARGLRHRAVHILAFDRAGRVFLQKRSMRKDTAPGKWDSSCSGHVDAGEDYDFAAVRELGEELGLSAAVPVRWFRVEASAETSWEFTWVYRLRSDGPFLLNADEIDGGEWLQPDEVTERIAARPEDYSRTFRFIWARATAQGAPL